MIRFVDLFAGTGGMRLGLQRAASGLGYETECVLSSEIDARSRETYELNFGEIPQGDIYQIQDIPSFDFLLAGFPCQPFSYAGKQRGFGDTRGTLFFEIERILRTHKPRGFLLENVRGLTAHDGGKTFKTILLHLEELGYGVRYVVLNSSSLGLPQNRVRVYILGLLGGKPDGELQSDLGASDSHRFRLSQTQLSAFRETPNPRLLVKDILESEVSEKYYCSDDFVSRLRRVTNDDLESLHGKRLIDYRGGNSIHSWELGLRGECSQQEIDLMNSIIKHRRLERFGKHQDGKRLTLEQIATFFPSPDLQVLVSSLELKGYLKGVEGAYNPTAGNMSFEVYKFLDPESISVTLVSSDAQRLGVVQRGQPRRITPREAARLQGFPEEFLPHPVDKFAYYQFGNAVSVPVVEAVLTDYFSANWGRKRKTK